MTLIIAALAAWQIVEIWHHSLLMAPLRARTEMWNNKLGELLVCPFCLSVWVGLACAVGIQFPGTETLVLAFAVSRLANLGNDVFHTYCRTPRVHFDPADADFSSFTEGDHGQSDSA